MTMARHEWLLPVVGEFVNLSLRLRPRLLLYLRRVAKSKSSCGKHFPLLANRHLSGLKDDRSIKVNVHAMRQETFC
jgi:hypothetical protein